MSLYEPAFRDLSGTVIIIDEIQESPAVYNLIREFTRSFKYREKLEDVIYLFCTESTRYFDDILDTAVYDNIFCSVARILVWEKRDWTGIISVKACRNWWCMIMTATSANQYATVPSCGYKAQASLTLPER